MNSRSFFFFIFDLNFGTLFDDTDSDGLFHISDSESTKRWIFSEYFNTHSFSGDHINHAGLS